MALRKKAPAFSRGHEEEYRVYDKTYLLPTNWRHPVVFFVTVQSLYEQKEAFVYMTNVSVDLKGAFLFLLLLIILSYFKKRKIQSCPNLNVP
ncbi:hypothetical protein COY07_02645 [Candidatus Peregrinibacteria bacterium CG_4_10_14_0_2_um_filter_43_11]|nr:MAG: hypothetical protein COY07_02645 [Candidatus Peregrinibacteria bacterium CG_4_10_14_0_2_um_filter_43_11]